MCKNDKKNLKKEVQTNRKKTSIIKKQNKNITREEKTLKK